MGPWGCHGQFSSSLSHPPRNPWLSQEHSVQGGPEKPRPGVRDQLRGSQVNQPDRARDGVENRWHLLPPPYDLHAAPRWEMRVSSEVLRSGTWEGQGSARGNLVGLHENHLCPPTPPSLVALHPQNKLSDAFAGHFPASMPLH